MVTARLLLASLALLSFAACSDGGGGGTDSQLPPTDDGEECQAGFLGCDCIQNTACWPGSDWICVDGTCQEPSCATGTEGCACFANNSCHDQDGVQLACSNGLCAVPECMPGTMGCPCADGGFCARGLACDTLDGALVCAPEEGCIPGESGCICGDERACDAGLICNKNACIQPSCIPGDEGCYCLADLSCGDGLQCNGEERCEVIPCSAGSLGCDCREGRCDAEDAYCDADGLCQEASCLAGQEGCACLNGTECATAGEARLFCEAGTCRRESCEPGEPGCACFNGAVCDPGGHCQGGTCVLDRCSPGSGNCVYAGGACHPGFRCRTDNICVDSTGAISGRCYEDGTCDRGGRCADDVCVRCTLGLPGCGCTDSDSCFEGAVCRGERCVSESEMVRDRERPENPPCYTPCTQSVTIDGDFYHCDSDGLMAGCFDDRECREGNCLKPDEEPRDCVSEFDCPFFQTCWDGLCTVECDANDECADGLSCFRHACRATCNTTTDPCPSRHTCETVDGDNGFCVPDQEADEERMSVVPGNFRLSEVTIELTNSRATGSFQVINEAPTPQRYTVRKTRHEAMLRDGSGSSAVRANNGPVLDCERDCVCTNDRDCADDGDVCRDGACRPRNCTEGTCPLFWLTLGVGEQEPQRADEVSFELGPGAARTVNVAGAEDNEAVRWEGTLEVHSDEFGEQQVAMTYNEIPEGHWAGEMIYFGDFGVRALEDWRNGDRSDVGLLEAVGNALVQRWGAVRRGRISWEEFLAVLQSTATGSWQFPNVEEACESEACYLYDIGVVGVATFSNDLESVPVPTGPVEMPFGVNLRFPDPMNDPAAMSGAVESNKALQYAGRPQVNLRFDVDPTECSDRAFGACYVYLDEFEFESVVGGRYPTTPGDDDCEGTGGTFEAFGVPWLIPGFTAGTYLDGRTGRRYSPECRDSRVPFDPDEDALANLSLARANPVPDGMPRRRTLRMLDGALVNQSQLFVLFEERFESFLDDDDGGFSAYGFMLLERRATDIDTRDDDDNGIADVFEGANPPGDDDEVPRSLASACSAELLAEVLPNGDTTITGDNVAHAVHVLTLGTPIRSQADLLSPDSIEQPHYLCESTGLIDGGAEASTPFGQTSILPNDESCRGFSGNGRCDDGGPGSQYDFCAYGTDRTDCGVRYDDTLDIKVPCPEGSTVVWFTVNSDDVSQADIAALPCQQDGSCFRQLAAWADTPGSLLQIRPRWECANERYCDSDRAELRRGKRFYERVDEPSMMPLRALADDAFRYEAQFRGRDGGNIGFTPEVCDPSSPLTPYCYDPGQIEQALARVDCLLEIHRQHYDLLDDPNDADKRLSRDLMNDYLRQNFSEDEEERPGQESLMHDGLERQFAELMIMLGDQSLVSASFSRFSLGEINTANFEGSQLEQDGLDLAGPVGHEMSSLYRAVQYYQQVLDRFYAQSPAVYDALDYNRDDRNFVTPATVLLYFDRVVRASTQKARVYGEIAKRYHQLGEPELARRVSQRAFTAAYLESTLMSRMMLRVVTVSLAEDRRDISSAVNDAQKRYRASLLAMQDVHSEIQDNLTVFGFAPEYVPFPALDREDFRQSNAFEILLNRARAKVTIAREREELAINSNRDFETNEAQFQAELGQLRNNYEGQLGEICGTFEVRGRIYPAIKKYAHLTEATSLLGDPCGFVGNGQLTQLFGQVTELRLETTGLAVSYSNVFAEVNIERQRVSDYCGEILELAEMIYEERQKIVSMQDDIRDAQQTIGQLNATSGNVSNAAMGNWLGAVAGAGAQTGTYYLEEDIHDAERAIADAEIAIQQWELENQCDLAVIDSEARVASMRLRLRELNVEALKIEARLRQTASEIVRVRNLARRLQIEQEETEELQINVQAAHNDPNVRIFRNDAILNAEISFDDALREVYKLTRVYEYFTSQTYADKADLFLIRLVSRGDRNLENYVADIENAFFEFEEFFGNPATRVHILSLRDDIMAIPQLDADGRAYSDTERTALMRQRLADPSNLDENGYTTLTFSTSRDELSPLTRNHKLLYVEADVYGNDTGDYVGRIYLRSKGTGAIHSVGGDIQYYRFDERTAVLNTIFGGVRYFDPSVYQSYRFRDRPFVNSQWEFVINQRDERVNQDLNLASLTDIRLYLYYHDVTVF